MNVLCVAILKIIPHSIVNKIKCHTKIQTELMLSFCIIKTFVISNKTLFYDKVTSFIYTFYFKIFNIVMATIPIASQITASTDEDIELILVPI